MTPKTVDRSHSDAETVEGPQRDVQNCWGISSSLFRDHVVTARTVDQECLRPKRLKLLRDHASALKTF